MSGKYTSVQVSIQNLLKVSPIHYCGNLPRCVLAPKDWAILVFGGRPRALETPDKLGWRDASFGEKRELWGEVAS
jgi:hypothetical protein